MPPDASLVRSPWASDPARSRGREFPERPDGVRGPRTAFQRDRDRIVHSIAFRRLRGKTQVFIAPDGDHYRVRLTHSLEVAQIGRVIARALGLDEDLTEALCLAHDIGHPPFGHAGEAALDAALAEAGGFDHNAHTLRTLMRLESPYCDWPGLNLSWETLEGLAKHNGPVLRPNRSLAALDADFPLDLARWPSLEAQVAALADDIAYDNHDVDDGLRAGLLSLDALLADPLWEGQWRAIERRFPHAPLAQRQRELVRDMIGLMVNDLIAATTGRLAGSGIAGADEARAAGRALVGFSEAMAAWERRHKAFMYREVYHHAEQKRAAALAASVVSGLFEAYAADPGLLPEGWTAPVDARPGSPGLLRHIADFIGGMTDRYAMRCYAMVAGPVPEGLALV